MNLYLSRRRALQSFLAAGAAICPRLGLVAANDRITLGFIGVGTMGRGHLNGFLGRGDVQVVAVCDVVQERIDHAVQQAETRYAELKTSGTFKGVSAYRDFRELLEHPGLDAVVIATPDHWHAIGCILAARAGKHIYCEKPLTHNIAEGRRIVEEVRKANVKFQTGSQQRSEFGGYFRKAVEYIWNGRIGRVKSIRIGVGGPARPCDLPAQEAPPGTDWNMWLGPAPERAYHEDLCPKGVHKHFPSWRNYQEFAGGGLADMGAHHFDIAQWALQKDAGGPVEILPPSDASQGHGLRFVYDSGVTMFHNEFEGDLRADCVFEGTDGVLLLSRSGISSLPKSVLEEPLGADARRVEPSGNHHQNWIEGIRQGRPCICPAEVGHRSATICHLANIGYRLRRPLKWNASAEEFDGDNEANALRTREPRDAWRGI
jgi:predicted dehydrogenase